MFILLPIFLFTSNFIIQGPSIRFCASFTITLIHIRPPPCCPPILYLFSIPLLLRLIRSYFVCRLAFAPASFSRSILTFSPFTWFFYIYCSPIYSILLIYIRHSLYCRSVSFLFLFHCIFALFGPTVLAILRSFPSPFRVPTLLFRLPLDSSTFVAFPLVLVVCALALLLFFDRYRVLVSFLLMIFCC